MREFLGIDKVRQSIQGGLVNNTSIPMNKNGCTGID